MTLQTISIGSSFRFADLKAYQHNIEVEILVILSRSEADGPLGTILRRVGRYSHRTEDL